MLYLFYCGVELRGTNPSFSFASFVSAIETLMAYGAKAPNHCKECGQPKYRLIERFRKFIFSFGYGGNESAGARKFINKLYNHRSKMGRILFTQGLARRNKSMFNKLDIFYCELITIQWSRRRVDSGFTLRPCKLGSYLGHCSPETLGENNNRKKVN
jgi:hypothetical protein